jgi:cation diffusion facilitator CzcD-associated flavoprotein CzcO
MTEHVDVLVVGAGISGVGAAYHLTQQCPERSFVVLEALESFGGTWLVHRYPGVRSDSDLYTFGYRFKPWTGPPIATAEQIQKYLHEVIEENGLADRIRYRHRIEQATWSSETNQWTVEATRTDTGERVRFTANFLWMCQGYYRHAEGHTPAWPGMDRYCGTIVHPQTWPEDLDYRGKRVLVIGSGATTATLVPAIAGDCEHVTVLQRSPTYFWSGRNANELADTLRELEVPEEWIHEILRRKILHDQAEVTRLSFEAPEFLRDALIGGVRDLLPEGYDVETHFSPKYRPWQQRLAFVPDGDLFAGIRAGKASMVTDEIETFTETGVRTVVGV